MVVLLKLGCNATIFEDKVTTHIWQGNDIKEYVMESMTPNIERAIYRRVLVFASQQEYAAFLNNSYIKDSSNCNGINGNPGQGTPIIPTLDNQGAFSKGFDKGFDTL